MRALSLSNHMVEKHFRWRGQEMTRIEAFSDCVFAFAITLLVVALEVPHSFSDLLLLMRGFVAFAVCFALIAMVWTSHCDYFRRYGLQTDTSRALNSALLFVVLLYVYPLKFLFTLVIGFAPKDKAPQIELSQAPTLMIVYGLGFAAVFFILTLLYLHAYHLRRELDLNEYEIYVTRAEIINHSAMVCFGLGSALLAAVLPVNLSGLAGWLYMGISVYYTAAGMTMGKKRRLLAAKMDTQVSSSQAPHDLR